MLFSIFLGNSLLYLKMSYILLANSTLRFIYSAKAVELI